MAEVVEISKKEINWRLQNKGNLTKEQEQELLTLLNETKTHHGMMDRDNYIYQILALGVKSENETRVDYARFCIETMSSRINNL